MGFYRGPKVITDGLVLALDAANKKSYPGTGTAWGDLSGNDNDGTLTNGPTFDSDNLGSIDFDGTNEYSLHPHDSDSMDFSSYQTICMWLKSSTGSSSTRRNPYNQAYGGPGTITLETSGLLTYFYGTNGGNGSPYSFVRTTSALVEEEITFISVVRNNDENILRWYINGVFNNSAGAGGYASATNGTNSIRIGDGYVSPPGFLGNIYSCFVYNTALSADEILQNYNATKGRFGL
jgi:hypothetical protein